MNRPWAALLVSEVCNIHSVLIKRFQSKCAMCAICFSLWNPIQVRFVLSLYPFQKNYIDCWLDLHIPAEVREFWHSYIQSHHISCRILPNLKPRLLNLCSVPTHGLRNTKFIIQNGNKYICNAFCNSITSRLTLMTHAFVYERWYWSESYLERLHTIKYWLKQSGDLLWILRTIKGLDIKIMRVIFCEKLQSVKLHRYTYIYVKLLKCCICGLF